MKRIFLAVLFSLAGCATQGIGLATPVKAGDVPQVSPDLLQTAITDFTAASARAKAFAAASTDPSIQKLSLDRAACYDTFLTHLNSLTGQTSQSQAQGFFDLQEKALELHDQFLVSTGTIPLDIKANCASAAAQVAGAVTDLFNKVVGAVTVVKAIP